VTRVFFLEAASREGWGRAAKKRDSIATDMSGKPSALAAVAALKAASAEAATKAPTGGSATRVIKAAPGPGTPLYKPVPTKSLRSGPPVSAKLALFTRGLDQAKKDGRFSLNNYEGSGGGGEEEPMAAGYGHGAHHHHQSREKEEEDFRDSQVEVTFTAPIYLTRETEKALRTSQGGKLRLMLDKASGLKLHLSKELAAALKSGRVHAIPEGCTIDTRLNTQPTLRAEFVGVKALEGELGFGEGTLERACISSAHRRGRPVRRD